MILDLYRARLMMAMIMVGERDISPHDVDGLKLAVSDLEENLTAEQASERAANYRAIAEEARKENDRATERGMWWAIRAMEHVCKA